MPQTKDAPRIAVPVPPVIYLVPLLLGGVVDWMHPVALCPGRLQYAAAAVLAAAAGGIMLGVLPEFQRVGTNFDARKPTTRIVTGGAYRFSRNPAYVALTLVYLAIALAVDSAWLLAGAIPAVLAMHYGVILPEERYLEEKFGNEYLSYKLRVRRWI